MRAVTLIGVTCLFFSLCEATSFPPEFDEDRCDSSTSEGRRNLINITNNLALETGCDADALGVELARVSFFQTPRSNLLSRSIVDSYDLFCNTSACYSAVRQFIQRCYSDDFAPELITFIDGMCSQNEIGVSCYEVVSRSSGNPGSCYTNLQNNGNVDECSHNCRLDLLEFSLDVGCCANNVYDIDFTRYLFYMDDKLWNSCGVSQPGDVCTYLPGSGASLAVNALLTVVATTLAAVMIL